MGELINLKAWKLKKEEREIESLRQQVKDIINTMGPIEPEFYNVENDKDIVSRMTSLMMSTLDGYSKWPIDSSDM